MTSTTRSRKRTANDSGSCVLNTRKNQRSVLLDFVVAFFNILTAILVLVDEYNRNTMIAFTTQRFDTLIYSVFIRGGLISKLVTLYTANNMSISLWQIAAVIPVSGYNPVDLKSRKSTGTSCQIEIHFLMQTIKLLMKYNLLCL